MSEMLPQCQSCGKKDAAYNATSINGDGQAFHYCHDCWKRMQMSVHQFTTDDVSELLMAHLMKSAPRVIDREGKTIREHLLDSIATKARMLASPDVTDKLREVSDVMITCLRREGTIFTCGAGVGAGEALHVTQELVGLCKLPLRRGLPAICLKSSSDLLDDFSYDNVFVRQVEALVNDHDVLLGICFNGNSPPVVRALRKASEQGAFTIGISGGEGGEMLDVTRLSIVIPSIHRHHVQECQQAAVHVLCQLVEQALCDDSDNSDPVLV